MFGLIRMLCINSYKRGKVHELLLEKGHVLVLGRNGAGKTALVQLIPLFYGTQPSAIVGKSVVKSTLAEFLLGTRFSYIAFEYQRHPGEEGKRLAVLRTGEEGRIVYQLFRCGYDQRLFLNENNQFRDFADLRHTAASLGYTSSQVLNNADYVRVIQNVPSPTKRADDLSRLAADYACVEAGRNLRHIEKVVGSMFKESAGFDDLQHIVISSLRLRSELTNTRELRLNKSEIYGWLDQRSAYLAIMKHAETMQDARTQAAQLEELERRIGRIRAQTSRLHGRAVAAHDKAVQKKESLGHEHTKTMQTLAAIRSGRENDVAGVKGLLGEARAAQGEIAKRREHFAVERAQDKANELEHVLPMKKRQLDAATKRKEILVGEQRSVEQKYEALKLARQKQGMEDQRSVQALREDVRNQADAAKSERDAQERLELSAIDATAKAALGAREDNRQLLVQDLADRNAELQRPQATAETVKRMRDVDEAIEAVRLRLVAAGKKERGATTAKNEALAAFQELEHSLAAAQAEESRLRDQLENINGQISPRGDSLLAFLRNNCEGWEGTLGKVIDPELLSRQDLDPTHETDSASAGLIMGVRLDIDRIEPKPELSIEHLKAARVNTERAIDEQQVRVRAAATALQAGGDQVKAANDALSLATSGREQLESQDRHLREQLIGLKTQQQAEIAACIEGARKAVETATDALRHFDDETTRIRQQYADKADEVRTAARQAFERATVELTATLARYDDDLRAKNNEEERDLAALDLQRVAALQNKGVDPEQLAAVERDIEDCDREVKRIGGFQKVVSDWNAWKAATEVREPELARTVAQHERDKEFAERELAKVLDQIKDEEELFERTKAAIETKIEQSAEVIRRCDTLPTATALDITGSLTEYPEERNEASLITIQTLEEQAGTAVREHRQVAQKLRGVVDLVRSAMRNAEDTAIRDFYTNASQEVGDSENGVLWAKELAKWFDFGHRQVQQALAGRGKNIADTVQLFHNELTEFALEIRRFNSALQAGLDRSMTTGASGMAQFDKLRDLKITVTSRLQEEKMWDPMNAFVAEINALSGRGFSGELQGDGFAAALRKVLGVWGTDNSLRIDLASQIRIKGEITENGHRKLFASAQEFKDVSSSGLTCIILMIVLCAFVSMIRGESKAMITWALDETARLDAANIRAMLDVLQANRIGLVTATPDLPKRSMQQFNHIVLINDERELLVATPSSPGASTAKIVEVTHV